MIFVKLMKPFKCYLKIYPRRIFEEAGDDGGGVDFAAPPHIIQRTDLHDTVNTALKY